MAIGALFTWLILGLVVIGLGLPIAVRVTRSRLAAIRASLWIGLLVLVVVILLLSLVAPIRSTASLGLVVALAGVAGFTSLPKFIRMPWQPRQLSWLWFIVFLGAFVAAGMMWALSTAQAPTNYDTGLYHLGAIEYVAQAGTVSGLANLHAPLGYGNALIPLAAFLTNGPMGSQGFEALNSFLLLLLPLDFLLRSYAYSRPRIGALVLGTGILAVFPPMIAMADAWVISPTSDTAVLVLTLAAVSTLAPTVRSGRITTARVLLIVSPLAVAGAMRPQAWLMFAAVLAVLVLVRFRLSRAAGKRTKFHTLLAAALIPPALVAAAGLARDAVLSGWWLFPLNRFPLPVEWRAENPSALLSATLGIARDPGPAYQQAAQGYEWLLPWTMRLPQTWEFWLLTGLTLASIVLLTAARTQGQAHLRRLLLVATPGLLASVVWLLLTPPSFRFGWGPLFSTVVLLFGWGWVANKWADRWIAGVGGALVLTAAVVTGTSRMTTWPAELPYVSTNQTAVTGDLVIITPVQGDQCWATFPLCSPAPADGLELRGPDWTSGFNRGANPG